MAEDRPWRGRAAPAQWLVSGGRLKAGCSALTVAVECPLAGCAPSARSRICLRAPSPARPSTRPPASDCGVFTCMCADFASQRLPLRYCQDDMENARLRIGLSILRGRVVG